MIDTAADPGSVAPIAAAPRARAAYAVAAGAVLLAVVAAYGAWRFQRDLQARLDVLAGASDAANAERQRLAATLEALRRDVDSQTAAGARAEAERKAFAADLAALKDSAGRVRPAFDATLAEAEFLAFLAVERLAADYDPAGAAAALAAADALLAGANRPELAAVREQIAHDRAALAAASVPDVQQLAFDLTRAEHDLEALPLRAAGATTAPAPAPRAGWRDVFAAMWRDVLSLVEVRDVTPGDALLRDPAHRMLLRQDLRQELAVAKYAALRRDSADFHASIGVVLAILKAEFDGEDATVAALVSRLDALNTLDLAPPLPAIGGSLEMLRTWRAQTAAGGGAAGHADEGAGL